MRLDTEEAPRPSANSQPACGRLRQSFRASLATAHQGRRGTEGKRQRMGRTRNNFRLLTFATVLISGHATVRLTGTGSAGRYGGGWRVQITSPQVASRLVGAEHADVGSDGATSEPAVWACVDREPCEGGKLTDRFEPQIKEGLPDAVARLRPQRALIDQLCLSIPQVELVDP